MLGGCLVVRGAGLGVGRSSIGRSGAFAVFELGPARGPGEPSPLGPGLDAVPCVLAIAAAWVGLGLGTPACVAGGADERAAGAGATLGAALARTAAGALVGIGLGAAGAGVARAVGAAVGAGGRGERTAVATAVGAGEGAALGGVFSATAIGATVGTLIGAAGSSALG